jgi:hypothetical protein
MPNSGAIDAALTAVLLNDATLTALLPDGVYFDEAKQGATRFVIVSLVDEFDEAVYGTGRAIEDALYLVKAVVQSTTGTNADTAAARIDVLLDDQPLTVSGYTHMATFREERVRLNEVDDVNPAIRWQHRGGRYRIQCSI